MKGRLPDGLACQKFKIFDMSGKRCLYNISYRFFV